MTKMQVIAPAKINLSLKILGRRDDGFHEIETLIAPISLADKIDICLFFAATAARIISLPPLR